MISFTTISMLGWPTFMLDLKKEYDKTRKNIPTVSEDFMRTDWKCMKTALIF